MALHQAAERLRNSIWLYSFPCHSLVVSDQILENLCKVPYRSLDARQGRNHARNRPPQHPMDGVASLGLTTKVRCATTLLEVPASKARAKENEGSEAAMVRWNREPGKFNSRSQKGQAPSFQNPGSEADIWLGRQTRNGTGRVERPESACFSYLRTVGCRRSAGIWSGGAADHSVNSGARHLNTPGMPLLRHVLADRRAKAFELCCRLMILKPPGLTKRPRPRVRTTVYDENFSPG